jgi:EAL domain-containing protein (putative c-di-GMP-specific phosphodiesterase class I)
MYHAKQTGLDYYLYEPNIDTHSRNKLAIMSNLRIAIQEDQFILHYQPKLDLLTNTLIGFEALLRWQHPEEGLVYPDQFIELVEMSDLIHPLTILILRKALLQLIEWNKIYKQIYHVAVNISSRNLLDSDFPDQLASILDETDYDPALLELEITESALISDPEHTRDVLHSITDLGIKLSIDDFGTGYSSLAYLKQLPIHALKIDRGFVMDMDNNEHDETIVTSTITLAHNLGLEVVAEGVENESILEKLAAMKCNYAQGYHISKPLSPEQVAKYLDK